MTTVAWDGVTLAADRQVTFGNSADCETTKIARGPDGSLIGIVGRLQIGAALLRWFAAGRKDERPALGDGDDGVQAIIINADGTLELHDRAGWAEITAPKYALGSGCEYAFGAMAMGADAVRAVYIAALYDTKTSNVTDALKLERQTRAAA